MIRLLERNYRKMEKIIRILSISDKWMTKKELAKRIGSSESTFVRYNRRDQNPLGNGCNDSIFTKIGVSS
ncbi:TPA: hypothetical protein ACGVYF_000428 [Enterococcus faecium]|uniref:hypothetical protein n=1 Tax=Enterococcus TaxID=1350 RepID=UPI00032E2EFA|nr:hypothetical protein [Enterococcus faecium]KKJ67494.1 hypothetical protein T639_09760 [Enterococcus faecium MRSN 11639]OFK29281.1 hypothetical protein HMPREF2827_09515 [Enterococcus sp. HMSC077E07]OFN33435.1 hypothetical protein HMPREF2594_03465 [Enterococcus sp. HMSC077E04]OFP79553.1 hypothetical protein HMPREF2973_04985 [Enterococcus sp. HMSC060E05]AON60947.1 hypothetical protein AL025_08700 [Enterococcus faecium]